jgi:phage/plasmid-like protein (TIGR03299 family)
MAHEIDTSTNTPAVAYVGETPWHGLGQKLPEDAGIDTWRKAARLDWTVKEGAVYFDREMPEGSEIIGTECVAFPARKALYRSDTRKALSIVSDQFKVVQPGDVLEFFRKLVESHGFKMETAGALRGGRRIWGLARIAEEVKVLDDVVQPYCLLSTAYDASMATWARLCTTRVVCANTIAYAETEKGHIVRVPHNAELDFDDVRLQLGLALNAWERFKVRAFKMAEREVTDPEAEAFLRELLGVKTEETPRGFARILELFKGAQLGSDKKSTRQTMWGVVQAVAEHVDHNPWSRSDETRMDAAWFGYGSVLKVKAFQKALAVIEPAANDEEEEKQAA